MRYLVICLGLLLLAVTVSAQTAVISPLNPIVQPGATTTLSCASNCGTGGSWACANISNGGTCLGSVNSSTGIYTAPASLAANQSIGGYQLFPNDHIENVNISALPVNTATGSTLTIEPTGTPGVTRTSGVVTLLYVDNGVQPPALSTVTVSGVTDSSFNGTVQVVHEGGCPGFTNNCFTYNNAGPDTTSGGGTVAVSYLAASGPGKLYYLPSLPTNYVNGSTTTDILNFYHTAANNGTYQVPQWPLANVQAGWFGMVGGDTSTDHHMTMIDTTNGNLSEIYHYVGQMPIVAGSCIENSAGTAASCTGTATPTSFAFNFTNVVGKPVAMGSFTGSDTWLNGAYNLISATTSPLTITVSVTHTANTTTTTAGNASLFKLCATGQGSPTTGACNASSGLKYTYADYALPANGSTDAAGMALAPVTLRADEVNYACANSGAIKHAVRFANSNFYIGRTFVWPATTQAATGTGVVPYGMRYRLKSSYNISGFSACAQILLTQLKNYGMYLVDGTFAGWSLTTDLDNLWPTGAAAMLEINNAGITIDNWEIVDESSLMEVSTSGATNTGEVVTYSATGVSSASTNIDLQGTAVDVATNQYYIMAGTPAQQLVGYSAAGGITWTMSPTVGTLTSGGLYTAPSSVGSMTTTTVTATSSVNGSVAKQMIVYVLPANDFRLIQRTANYTDSGSHIWNSGGAFGIGMSNIPSWQGCCQTSNSYTGTDSSLYSSHLGSSQTGGDYKNDFHVPNGNYTITFNNGTTWPSNTNVRYFYIQGSLLGTIDTVAVMGGDLLNYSAQYNAVVSNNVLSFYNAGIGYQTNNTGDISSISISQVSTIVPTAPIKADVLLSAYK